MNLSNKEIEKSLTETLENIKNEILDDNDEDIEKYLITDFNKLNKEDQQLFISFIQQNYSLYNFINHNRFKKQQNQNQNEFMQVVNQKELFTQLIRNKEWNQVINKFKDQNFCQENNIPVFWGSDESIKVISNNKQILPKLLELIEIYDYQKGYNYLNQILIYFQLLSDTYFDKQQDKQTIEIIIGSSLGKQILQYCEYKKVLQQILPKDFDKLMEVIRLTQLKLQTNYDISQLDQQCQVCFIIQTRLIDKKYLENYLRQLFSISEQQINFKALENQVPKLIFQSNKIQELYFILMFYFLNQYCNYQNFQNDFEKLEQKMIILQEIKQKETFIDVHCNKIMNKPDSIYQFLLSQLTNLKQEQLNNQFLEEYKIYQRNQQNYEKQLLKLQLNVLKIFSNSQKEAMFSLNLLRKVPLITISKIKPVNEKIEMTILIYSLLLQQNQQIIFELISSAQKLSLFQITQKLLGKQFNYKESIIYLFLLIGIIYNHPARDLIFFSNLYLFDNKFSNAEFVQNICDMINLIQQYQKSDKQIFVTIQKLCNTKYGWQIVDKIFGQQEIADIYEKLFEFYLNYSIDQKNKQLLYQILQNFGKLNQQPIQILVQKLSPKDFDLLFQQITFQIQTANYEVFEKILKIIMMLIENIQTEIQFELLDYLNTKSKNKDFNFLQIKELIEKGKNSKFIQYLLIQQFYYAQRDRIKFSENVEQLRKNDQNTYEEIVDELKKLNIFWITQQFLENSQKIQTLPRNASISLEDFNISLQEMSENDRQKIVDDWFSDMQNTDKFRKFIPLYFNVIKRKESSNNLLSLLNKNNVQQEIAFNMKAMFQILYNNSNNELKQMLLKLWSEINPLPLLFTNPNINERNTPNYPFCLNNKLNFVFPQCIPIINFSLSNKQNQFGKTSLINKVFYRSSNIFEESDNCYLNQNTIDIMFDFCFSGSRNLAIADVHGIIPLEIMIKILPLFKFCIIQMNSEDELQENYESFKNIKSKLQKWDPECCFIIRNSVTKGNNQLNQLEIDINNQGISIHKMIDLQQKGIDKQRINFEIEQFSRFIFDKIKKIVHQQSNSSSSQDYLTVLQNYYGKHHSEIQQICDDNKLIESIMKELQKFINDPNCFYSIQAFPMRSLMWQIKNLKQQQYQFDGLTKEQQIQQAESIMLQISDLEKQIPQSKPTHILKLFEQIFDSESYYNLYLKFTDQLRKFNEQNTYLLQEENQKINEDLLKKKQEKKQKQNQNQNVKDINDFIKKQKNRMEKNLKTIELRNIGIELFWRELIQIKQKGLSAQLRINPAKIVADMVKKGEPFEFLDGDQLEIDTKFLLEFIKNFPDPYEKVLVLSILGPQSSGKSTILNKIFGCHFWTSVGRCTKGIYLQLLKITQKSYFDNQFDYVLILDTEGLQNPNQNDPEFDKKIALFILAISDIILINVKGDIHSSFKNLVEMCIFTLGQMKSSISAIKQLSWCFNQNNDCKNFAPFLQQIQSIVNNLNLQINNTENEVDNSNFDYNEVLSIQNENIKILGFASTEQSWRVNSNTGIYDEWRQLIVNETFSEEAYLFGIQMIRQFLKKLQTQQGNSLQSLSSFVQNVESDWQSICRLPDLLEFTELLQYKQDQSMKKKYEELLQQYQFDYETKIPGKIEEQVNVEQRKILEFFKQLEDKEKQLIQQEKEQIQQQIENDLQKYKTENKITNKICKKYIKKLKDQLKTKEYCCHMVLLEEIKKYEIEFQQRKGFKYIEDLVEKICQNVEEIKNLKGNKELIDKQFNQVWSKILSEAKEQQEQVFQDYSQALYKAIYSQFTQYQYNSQNSEQFIKFFQQMSCTPPIQQNYNEKQTIFNIYIKEIQSQQQFQIIINNNQNMKYYDIFCQPLSDRFKRCDCNCIVNLNNFYQSRCSIYYIAVKDFKQYLLSDSCYNDFSQFKKDQESNYQNTKLSKEKVINQIMREFICILEYCQISYNREKLDELKQNLMNGNKWYQFGDNFKSYFNNFQNSFKLKTIFNQQIMQPEFTRNLQYYYPSLKFQKTEFKYNNSQEYQKQLEQYSQYVLFLLYNKSEPKQQNYLESFNYIADQKGNYNLVQKFNSQIIEQFSEIMLKCEGWQKIYSEIYDIIKSKMIISKNQNEKVESDSENEETQNFDNHLIKQLMDIIEQKILQYNKQFANFGIILSSIGERLIYYYSMFIIWRFSCYSKWKQLDINLQKLYLMKNEQLNRFTITIEQDTTEQSVSNARILAKSIKSDFLDRFYQAQLNKVKQSIDSIEQKCSVYVKRLDQRLLENYSKAKQNNIKDSEIQDYILDQKEYIEKSVDNLIKKKEMEILQEYEQKLRQELQIFLKKVFFNIKIIYDLIKQQKKVLSEKYFETDNDALKKEDYDNKLFQLICQCIRGEQLTNQQLQSISKKEKEIFTQEYEHIKSPIFVRMFNDSEKRIPLLKPFIQELHNMIEREIQNCSKELLVLSKLQVRQPLNKVKLSLIGCLHTCPLCKRKCDQQSDSNHKHSCSNGHQLRGMNGVLIYNKPSLLICEEIEDDSLIQTSDSTIQKKWSDIKKAYPEWNFINLNDQKVIELKEKMENIWNSGIGQLVCQQLSKKLNIDIQFIKKTRFNQVYSLSIHYIIMLDDSGSMTGEKWENARNGALQCMEDIAKNGEAKVSVIIFNSDARVVIDCERVDIDKQKDKIAFKSGNTNFNNAFLKAYDQLQKHVNKNFDKIIILFYTDGQDKYPADAVQKFCSLSKNLKTTLQLVSCSEGELNQIASLVSLTENFKNSGISADLKSNIIVNDLQKIWAEVVNQNYHKIKF